MVPDGKDVCSTFESKEWRGEQQGAGGGFCKGAREITPKLAGVQRGVATVTGVWRMRPGVQGLHVVLKTWRAFGFAVWGIQPRPPECWGCPRAKSPSSEPLDAGDAAECLPQVLRLGTLFGDICYCFKFYFHFYV